MQTDSAETITAKHRDSVSITERVKRVKRLGFRRMTRAHLALAKRPGVSVQANEALAAVCEALRSQLGAQIGMQARLLESAVSPFGALARTSAFALLELSPSGTKAALEIDLPLLCGLLEKLSGGAGRLAAATKLTRIEEAAFGYLCLVALAAVRGHQPFQRRYGPRLLSVHRDRGEVLERLDCTLRYVGIEVTVTIGAATGLARLLLPAPHLQSLVQDAEVASPREIAPEVLAASLWARCLLGRARLDAADLQMLAVGDAIVFDHASISGDALFGAARLVTRTFELHGELGQAGFEFSRAFNRAQPKECTMSTPHDETNALPIEVEIELTRVRLSLSELSLLKPGVVLPLHMNAAQPVVLRVGDRAVARAELVEIEGEVGARITSLQP